MEEMYDQTKSFYERFGRWILMFVIALAVGWLWVSWRNAWFPFGTFPDMTSSVIPTPQQTQENILQSLTAPVSATSSPVTALKQLTPATPSKTTKTVPTSDNTSVLDSLTPPKK